MPKTPAPTLAAARAPSLAERHADHTRQWIVAAAVDVLEELGPAAVLTNAAVAGRAGISERTVYRHFATREALLDALAAEVAQRLGTPPVPSSPEALLRYPGQLFACFEARPQLTRSALTSEVFSRMRDGPAAQRWRVVQQMLDAHLPALPEAERAMTAANIRYLLAATTWHYYRHYFGFSLEQTVRCVQQALAFQLQGLGLTTVDTMVGAVAHKASRRRRG